MKMQRNCPGTPRWCPGTPSERWSVDEFALEKLAFRSLARPQAAFCGTTWAVTKSRCNPRARGLYGLAGMSGVSMGTKLGLVLAFDRVPYRLAGVAAADEGGCLDRGPVRAWALAGCDCAGFNHRQYPVT